MTEQPKPGTVWRHKLKGGRYTIDGVNYGAGVMKGYVLINYTCADTGLSFTRALLEWYDKMEPTK